MTHNTRSLLFAAAVLAATTTRASAGGLQTVSYSSTLSEMATNWTQSTQLHRFDPSLGNLQSIEFTVEETVFGNVRMESLDSQPSVVHTQFESFLSIDAPDNTTLDMPIPLADYMDTFGAYDGTVDFKGPSGLTHSEVTVTHSVTHQLPPTTSLAAFTGAFGAPGDMTVTVTATGFSTSTGSGNLITQFEQRARATVTVTYSFLGNTPPTFSNCIAVFPASVGVPIVYQVCASDSDSTAPVTLTVSGLPAGAVLSPVLPTSGNPVCTTLTWTPTIAQTGTNTVTFTATDANQRTATCQVTFLIAECHMMFAMGSGNSQQILFGQLFNTQLSDVRRSYPVTMEDIPALPYANLPQTFFVQVVMYNPQMFPGNPDQWTYALRVDKNVASQTVNTSNYGTENGMHLSANEFVDGNGVHRIKFPFTIDGM